MSFGGLILTNSGRNRIAAAISSENPLVFSFIQLGDGTYNGSYLSKKELTNTVMQIPVTRVSRNENEVLIECDWNDKQAPHGFYLREIGIVGNDTLCYYDNAGLGDAEYIDPNSDVITKEKRFRFTVVISEDVNVITQTSSGLYALKQDVEYLDNAKVDKEEGKGLSEQNFTTELLNKLKSIENYANYYTHPDSGVAAGTKGTNNNQNINLDFGNKFIIPGFDVDEKGHITSANAHTVTLPNKPTYTKKDVGLGNVDDTPDVNKPVSVPVQEALNAYYAQIMAYVNKAIADLINGAPTTMDTLKELADAIEKNQDIQVALDSAIGTKVNQKEFDSHATTAASSTVSGHVKVDTTISDTSTNPVQNKTIKVALDGKASNSHTHSNMTAATASVAGKAGLVPAPAAGAQGKYLRGDGTWQTPPDTKYGVATASASGLMSAADKNRLDNIGITTKSNVHVSISQTSATGHMVASITLTSGAWILVGAAQFEANTAGERMINICDQEGYVSGGANVFTVRVGAKSGVMNLTTMAVITATSEKKYYLNCYQTSGVALTTQGNIQAVKIA